MVRAGTLVLSHGRRASCETRSVPYARAVDEIQAKVDEIERLLVGHTDRRDEAQILDLLAGASADELDGIFRFLDASRLLGDIDDRVLGPNHETRLIELLSRDRIEDLSVPVRADLICAFSRYRTSSGQERGIRDVLLATRGRALTELKNALDRGVDHRDLQHIVFSDIDDDSIRDDILSHLAREAASLPRSEVKVLSDIDDTFYCNWKDKRFPAKTVYPGVLQLYFELDRGPNATPGRLGDVAFVTARPKDRTGFVEAATHETLRALGLAECTVLAGSFLKLHGNEAIAERKLDNFRDYSQLFGEYDFVFLGDSGQGDASFGAAMHDVAPGRVSAVFIHDVVRTDAVARGEWAERGVVFFDTYIGAALAARELGLIEPEGPKRVADAAFAAFASIAFEDTERRDARRAELDADAARL